jgi:predicted membrane protein
MNIKIGDIISFNWTHIGGTIKSYTGTVKLIVPEYVHVYVPEKCKPQDVYLVPNKWITNNGH